MKKQTYLKKRLKSYKMVYIKKIKKYIIYF